MAAECDICRGSRRIRLPRYRLMDVMMAAEAFELPPTLEEASREFPCPQCGDVTDMVPYERVSAERTVAQGRALYASQPGYMDAMQRHLAEDLAFYMLRHNLITFKRGVDDPAHFEFPLTATVGVVAPQIVMSMEERINARQFEVAAEMLRLTEESIANWGSHYHGREGGWVDKSQALTWLREAFRRLKELAGVV